MTRVLSGVVLAAATLAAILFLPAPGLRLVAAIVAAVAAFEYVGLIGIDNARGRPAFVLLAGFTAWQLSSGRGLGVVAVTALFIAGIAAVFMRRNSSQQAILGAFAILYIGMPLGLLAMLNVVHGWRATLLLIATIVVSDSLQYYSGRAFGRHALAPAISPKKTIEGAVGGAVAGTVFMVLAGQLVFPASPWLWLAMLGLVMVLLGILGDLFESRLKREAHVKDSSSLIPGHGGVLDRIDALLFVTPVYAIALGVIR
ncbi:MAG TPA: phosphatidate cytidylyltransferase [Vicinamibacterales bacterium]|nr:phosphatidate cytidylyltransferase [Vicinamibacterales bacterium]